MFRDITDDYKSINISFLKKHGYLGCDSDFKVGQLNWSYGGESTGSIRFQISFENDLDWPYVRFMYRITDRGDGSALGYDYKMDLTSVPCYFGGVRWYFKCKNCFRRVGILYLKSEIFICRHCADLSYRSCNQNKRFRGWPYGFLSKAIEAEELYESLRTKYYRGKPTRRLLKCIKYMDSRV